MVDPTRRLLTAAQCGWLEEVRQLLAQRVDVNAISCGERSALHCAAKAGASDVIELLSEARAELNLETSCAGVPLAQAACAGSEDAVATLLRLRADVHGGEQCLPAIFQSAHKGHVSVLQLLLAHRASANARLQWDQTTPILQTSLFGHTAAVAELIAARADLTVRRTETQIQDCGATALFLAALHGHADTAQLLLENSCSVNAVTVDNESPLFAATKGNHLECLQVLLCAAADVNLATKYPDASTPLQMAVTNKNAKAVESLLNARANADQVNPERKTPRCLATAAEIIALLGVSDPVGKRQKL